MSNLVTIAESDLYFNKLKDRPEMIKHYIEAKSITEYINKSQEAQEIMTLYMNILRSCYDLVTKMRSLIISNTNKSESENQILKSTLIAYSEELDNSIMSMTYKKKHLLSGYKVVTESGDCIEKTGVKKYGEEKLDLVSFVWNGVCTKKDADSITIEWSKKILVDENKWELTYETGILKVNKTENVANIHGNFFAEFDLNKLEILDNIEINTLLEYNFLIGEKGATTTLFFPRMGTGLYSIHKTDIIDDVANNFKTIETKLIKAINLINQYIGFAGSEINVISMKLVNLKNRFNGLMSILNNYRENI